MGKIRKGHIHRSGTDESYRWILIDEVYTKVHPVKIGTRKGMYGQLIGKSISSKDLPIRHTVRDKDGNPITYRHIGISAVEHMKFKEKAAN